MSSKKTPGYIGIYIGFSLLTPVIPYTNVVKSYFSCKFPGDRS